jgi:hypothetical protein
MLLGLTQHELASVMGGTWSQKRVSQMERSATIMSKNKAQVAKALCIDVELIQDFDQATGRLALMQVLQAKDRIEKVDSELPGLLELIQQSLLETMDNLMQETRRIDQISKLVRKARAGRKSAAREAKQKNPVKKSVDWSDIRKEGSDWEVKEPAAVAWGAPVCAN